MSNSNANSKTNGTVYLTFSYKQINIVLLDNCGKLLMDRSCVGIIENESSATQADIFQILVEPIKSFGIKKVSVIIKGVSCARKRILSVIRDSGVEITSIKDVTSLPHNGCRPTKNKQC